jgi:hypothetical protein
MSEYFMLVKVGVDVLEERKSRYHVHGGITPSPSLYTVQKSEVGSN